MADGLPRIDISAPVDTPKGFYVTPGASDLDHGSDAPAERPAFTDMLTAAVQKNNTIESFIASEARQAPRYVEPGFNPWETIKGSTYEPHFSRFADVQNSAHANAIKRDIDREEENRKTLAAFPAWQRMPFEMAAGVFDLPTLLPGGSLVRNAKGGVSLLRSGATVAGAGAAGAAVQEVGLQATQQTRTLTESAESIGAAALLGGLLGVGGAKLMSHAEWNKSVSDVNAFIERAGKPEERAAADVLIAAEPGSIGAAAMPRPDMEGLSIAGTAAGGIAAATKFLNPALRLLQSPSAVTRDVGTKLFENSVYMKGNFENMTSAQAVETLMKEWNGGLADAVRATNEAHKEFRKAGGNMKADEFRQAVGRAMRNGDADDNPFVAKVAQEWRAKVFDPLKEAAIKAKLLPEDVSVETAASYFSRMWNRNKLIAREGEFKSIVQKWVSSKAPEELEAFDKGADRRLGSIQSEIDALEMAKLRRAEELKERTDGGEVNPEIEESDLRNAIRVVQGKAPAPKVETLTQWLHKGGGLVDDAGELAARGITASVRPGFVTKVARSQTAGTKGGRYLDDAAHSAWEAGFFPEWSQRPSVDEFLEALERDFHRQSKVVRAADRENVRLAEYVDQLHADLGRMGVEPASPRFSTSEELKGVVQRVHAAMDAEHDARIAVLREKLVELRGKIGEQRRVRFLDGDLEEHARQVADEVHATLAGRMGEGQRSEFITINSRGPMKERTFNIPDALVLDFLEHDVGHVGQRYTRVMGADVELANKFGRPDMRDQIQAVNDHYAELKAQVPDGPEKVRLDKALERDLKDLTGVRDLLRGDYRPHSWDKGFATMVRNANHFNYIRSMGGVVVSSLGDAIRPAMVHGLGQYMTTVAQLATSLKGIRLAVREGQKGGNITERALGHRMATISELTDPHTSRGPIEKFLENMTNVASNWNGIRIWTDGMKSITSVMTQDRILKGVLNYGGVKESERAYLRFLGINENMAERIADHFKTHGEVVEGVRVANTDQWVRNGEKDIAAIRAYRAAMNKDMDSIIVQKSVADVPLLANTPMGKTILQFKSFTLAAHQKVLLRGLQESQARFVGGVVALTTLGMFQVYLRALAGNRTEKLQDFWQNPGHWIAEGLDMAGVIGPLMEAANAFEKMTTVNPIKAPITAFDQGNAESSKIQNRGKAGALLGPTVGLVDDVFTAAGVPATTIQGDDVKQAQKNAAERLLPFNSYIFMRQFLRYVVNPPH